MSSVPAAQPSSIADTPESKAVIDAVLDILRAAISLDLIAKAAGRLDEMGTKELAPRRPTTRKSGNGVVRK